MSRFSTLFLLAALTPCAAIAQQQTVPAPTAPATPSAAPAASGGAQFIKTVQAIRTAGKLPCATIDPEDDWALADQHGDLSDLSAEVCKAVATAILGSPDTATIVQFPGEQEALAALRAGSVPLVIGVGPSTETAIHYGAAFGPPVFYDTLRFMVMKQSGVKDVTGLRDQLICAIENSYAERSLRDTMTGLDIPYGLQAHSEQGEMDASVAVGHCRAGAALETRLAQSRADFPAKAPEFVFLPGRYGLAPLVPAYSYGDQVFGLIVNYTVSALIEAEALGITQANVGDASKRDDMRAQRLLGGDFAVAQSLGLSRDWTAKVIAAVGNYGEIFDRTVGKSYHLERGYNALWTAGGLMQPMPMQ